MRETAWLQLSTNCTFLGEQKILFVGENFVQINEFNLKYFRKSVPKISFRIRNANFWFIGANINVAEIGSRTFRPD